MSNKVQAGWGEHTDTGIRSKVEPGSCWSCQETDEEVKKDGIHMDKGRGMADVI